MEPIRGDMMRVYPRPRGGTVPRAQRERIPRGLSPSTRGNPVYLPPVAVSYRSIPVHAGEPGYTPQDTYLIRVYPRPRGGTGRPVPGRRGRSGLSPSTRGNRRGRYQEAGRMRSIPVHAGEPRPVRLSRQSSWVYPRPRGGTDVDLTNAEDGWGLSPSTRGNLLEDSFVSKVWRSIPVHAGEPTVYITIGGSCWVYPRPRGGTMICHRTRRPLNGLSPSTRGNHVITSVAELRRRSIPVHAGEPRRLFSLR